MSTMSMPYMYEHRCDLTDKPSTSYVHTYLHVLAFMYAYLYVCIHMCVHACAHTHIFFWYGYMPYWLFNDSCSALVSLSSNDRLIGDISLVSVVRGFKLQRVKWCEQNRRCPVGGMSWRKTFPLMMKVLAVTIYSSDVFVTSNCSNTLIC